MGKCRRKQTFKMTSKFLKMTTELLTAVNFICAKFKTTGCKFSHQVSEQDGQDGVGKVGDVRLQSKQL